jgi:hypothetical protein
MDISNLLSQDSKTLKKKKLKSNSFYKEKERNSLLTDISGLKVIPLTIQKKLWNKFNLVKTLKDLIKIIIPLYPKKAKESVLKSELQIHLPPKTPLLNVTQVLILIRRC